MLESREGDQMGPSDLRKSFPTRMTLGSYFHRNEGVHHCTQGPGVLGPEGLRHTFSRLQVR